MKKNLLISLILILAMGFIFVGCGELYVAPPEPEPAEPIEINFSGAQISEVKGANANVNFTKAGYTTTLTGNYYGYAYFKVDLGSNKLSDYEKITFNFTRRNGGSDGTAGGAQVFLQAHKEEPKEVSGDIASNTSVFNIAQALRTSDNAIWLGDNSGADIPSASYVTIDGTKEAAAESGELYLIFYVHKGEGASWTIDTINFVPR